MGRPTNGKCHFCKTEIETLDHLFFTCAIIKEVWQKIDNVLQIYSQSKNVDITKLNLDLITTGTCHKDKTLNNLYNSVLNTVKWVTRKYRNVIKYQGKAVTSQSLIQYVNITFIC